MGYVDENDNNEYSPIEDIQNAKRTVDNVRQTVDDIKSIKSKVDTLKGGADAAKAANSVGKGATGISQGANAIKGASEAAKVVNAASTAATAGASASATATAAAVATTAATAASTGAKVAAIAAGAASGPVGWAALAVNALSNKKTRGFIIGIIVVFLFVVMVFPLVIGLLPIVAVSEFATKVYDDVKHEVGLYKNYYSVGEVNFNDEDDFWNHIYDKYQLTEEDITSPISLYGEELEMNMFICKEIIDNAIDWSFKAPRDGKNGGYWTEFVKSDTWLGKFFEATWDWIAHDNSKNASYESFLESQYPYTLCHESADIYTDGKWRTYYTIEDYMENRIPAEELNNDLNYAEVICMISLNAEMSSENFTFEKFYKLLMDKEFRKNFAELDYQEYYYKGSNNTLVWKSLEEMAYANGFDSVEDMESDWFFDVTSYLDYDVFPFGLRDLSKIANISLFATNQIMPPLSNSSMLDQFEIGLRSTLVWSDINLGISGVDENAKRDWRSKAYHTAVPYSTQGTTNGRSAFAYVDMSGLLYEGTFLLPEWDSPNVIYPTILYEPDGTAAILDFSSSDVSNSHSYYICQLDYPDDYRGPKEDGSTIKKEGCIDCCYTMCAQYLLDRDISIRGVCASFVKKSSFYSGGNFKYDENGNVVYTSNGFLNSVGLYKKTNTDTFNQMSIRAALIAGYPTVFCVYGSWWSEDGKTLYHKGKAEGKEKDTTHFITIIGYDDNGFYVLDPANRNRKQIPFNDFTTATITSWSIVADTTSGTNGISSFGSNNVRFLYSPKRPDFTNYEDLYALIHGSTTDTYSSTLNPLIPTVPVSGEISEKPASDLTPLDNLINGTLPSVTPTNNINPSVLENIEFIHHY